MRIIRLMYECSGEVVYSVYKAITYFVKNNMYNVAVLLEVICPYIMLRLGYYLYDFRGCVAVGSEIIVPIFVFMVAETIKKICNKLGKGSEPPVPDSPFVDSKGDMYYVDTDRYEELVLYMADLEEYFRKVGKL